MINRKIFPMILLSIAICLCCGCTVVQDVDKAAQQIVSKYENTSVHGDLSKGNYTNPWFDLSLCIPADMQTLSETARQEYHLAQSQVENAEHFELYVYDDESLELLITVQEGDISDSKHTFTAYEEFLKGLTGSATAEVFWQDQTEVRFQEKTYLLNVCDTQFYWEGSPSVVHRAWFMCREEKGYFITLRFSALADETTLDEMLCLFDENHTPNSSLPEQSQQEETESLTTPTQSGNTLPYTITLGMEVIVFDGPGYEHNGIQGIGEDGIYTIVEEQFDNNGHLWGKLKSGIGWVCITDSIQAETYTGENPLHSSNPLKFSSTISGRVYDISFVFEDNGTVYIAYGESTAGAIGGGYGTYTIANGVVTLSIKTFGRWEEYSFEFSKTNTVTFVQTSDKGIFDIHHRGDVFHLTENTYMTKGKAKELAVYFQEPVDDWGY